MEATVSSSSAIDLKKSSSYANTDDEDLRRPILCVEEDGCCFDLDAPHMLPPLDFFGTSGGLPRATAMMMLLRVLSVDFSMGSNDLVASFKTCAEYSRNADFVR